ncbi:Diphthamide biosynthesis protein 4 [Thelotrema lepadinum]|nr:Diphthamide biosynthesis protein 4 [Thelotrema lepadinum]
MPATHYEVLNLPFPSSSSAPSPSVLKAAYRRALLLHHPDKKSRVPSNEDSKHDQVSIVIATAPRYTVDQITLAYNTLSDPKLRAEYDHHLRLQISYSPLSRPGPDGKSVRDIFASLESIDLEGMQCDETQAEMVWWRGCRCGNERGFVVTEGDLEATMGDMGNEERKGGNGEIIVGCQGCSLGLRVGFGILEEG